jgi:hypothetical protein
MKHISHEAGTIFLNTIYKRFSFQRVNDILFIHKAQLPEEHSKGCKNSSLLTSNCYKHLQCLYLFINDVLIFTVEKDTQWAAS